MFNHMLVICFVIIIALEFSLPPLDMEIDIDPRNVIISRARCRVLKGLLMRVHYPKLRNIVHLHLKCFTASKGSNVYILFAITAAGVVLCDGPKKSPRTSSI